MNVEWRKYLILGACNPQFAYQALSVEDKIGTVMPCNVVLQEYDDGETEVSIADPLSSMMVMKNPKLAAMVTEVRVKLNRVIAHLEEV